MKLADQIRAYIDRAYLQPARQSGRGEIAIRAGDIHSLMELSNRMPAVCGALRSRKFEEEFGVELVQHTGPYQGANACYQFRLVDRQIFSPARERPVVTAPAPVTSRLPRQMQMIDAHAVMLVSCVKTKQARAAPAKDLYVSDWFLKARRLAEGLGSPWFILSANYGLVDPEELIEPYEKTLNKMPVRERRDWADAVFKRLTYAVPDLRCVVFLAGSRYREFLASHLQAKGIAIEVPMQRLGFGEQLRWLGQQVRHG